ncbi:adenine phosphoribosyltransferase [Kriegella aquimaris]|uniref:Adenine phosphoribosyltransferase n=1 Tax=Kriegella aquimaris TaxID=192904 RepID=A0A1G9XHN2_9FLAO|nr:adenine phosphoribosyltransferase [Kriegella aquimaris]SDM95755.1 adenine phosphoribosyltransferase [Kriegella aquimaris]
MDLKSFIRDIDDFPQQGVTFKDIIPLLLDANAMRKTSKMLFDMIGETKIDKVIGMESRGFFFAPLLADKLNAGFVPVRKPGKLPFEKISHAYGLEYGTDILEMHTDSILRGEKVLIHDDVLATGGTAAAVCKLVEQLGGEIVQCNFLIELEFLKGREKLSDYNVRSLLKY